MRRRRWRWRWHVRRRRCGASSRLKGRRSAWLIRWRRAWLIGRVRARLVGRFRDFWTSKKVQRYGGGNRPPKPANASAGSAGPMPFRMSPAAPRSPPSSQSAIYLMADARQMIRAAPILALFANRRAWATLVAFFVFAMFAIPNIRDVPRWIGLGIGEMGSHNWLSAMLNEPVRMAFAKNVFVAKSPIDNGITYRNVIRYFELFDFSWRIRLDKISIVIPFVMGHDRQLIDFANPAPSNPVLQQFPGCFTVVVDIESKCREILQSAIYRPHLNADGLPTAVQISAFDARDMIGGPPGRNSRAPSCDCRTARSNVGAGQIAYLDASDQNQSAGENREEGSIERDRLLRGPVPRIGQYVVVFCFIFGMFSAGVMFWWMGAFR